MSWIITGTQKNKGLLDEFSGAAAAYSLRNLTFLRGGPVVRVRRSSDNAQKDFTAAEVSDGSLASWVGAGNNGFVRTWYDQSGNGNNAVQTTSANQPTIVSSGSVILEAGKPTLQFDGINDKLQADGVSLAQPFQFFFVAKETTNGTVSNTFIDATGQRANFILSSIAGIGTSINAGATVSDGVYPSNIRTLYTALYNSTNSFIARQGTITATGDAGSGGLTQMTIGNNSGGNQLAYFTGPMQELIVYPSNQSANRIAIESNINAHYSIYP